MKIKKKIEQKCLSIPLKDNVKWHGEPVYSPKYFCRYARPKINKLPTQE